MNWIGFESTDRSFSAVELKEAIKNLTIFQIQKCDKEFWRVRHLFIKFLWDVSELNLAGDRH
jgi:hypothetical protein